MATTRKLWFRSALAYTLAGCISATLVGLALGTIGRPLSGVIGGGAFYFISVLSLLLAAREFGWIDFRLPERTLQTEKVWVREFGFITASAMWGLHIGLGFATQITYGGFWVLVTVCIATGDPIYGAVVMLTYWLGRALPVWLAPALTASNLNAIELSETIFANRVLYHRVVGVGLMWSAVVTALLALSTK